MSPAPSWSSPRVTNADATVPRHERRHAEANRGDEEPPPTGQRVMPGRRNTRRGRASGCRRRPPAQAMRRRAATAPSRRVHAAPPPAARHGLAERCEQRDAVHSRPLTIVNPAMPATTGVQQGDTTNALDAPSRNAPPPLGLWRCGACAARRAVRPEQRHQTAERQDDGEGEVDRRRPRSHREQRAGRSTEAHVRGDQARDKEYDRASGGGACASAATAIYRGAAHGPRLVTRPAASTSGYASDERIATA